MVLSICGPSGVGKTTAVRILSKIYPAYIEDVSTNPYLGQGVYKLKANHVYLNQKWFLDRMNAFIEGADVRKSLVLDQDPLAIVKIYAQKSFDENRINLSELEILEKLLEHLEARLRAWPDGRAMLFLDASESMLRQRVLTRDGPADTPPIRWFRELRSRFSTIRDCFKRVEYLDTTYLDEVAFAANVHAFAIRAINSKRS